MVSRRVKQEITDRRRAAAILAGLNRAFPDPKIALHHRNAFELLIATILSAQCTDERVNIVTRDLFRKYPSPADLANASLRELEEDIRPTGFYRNKAKSIQGASRMIVERFGGAVPETMEELVTLPGVARKTANVVLGASLGKAEGIVVDTHVARVSRRLNLTKAAEPEKIEQDLMRLLPRDRWISFSLQTILHGRHVCKARKPLCHLCSVEKSCTSRDKASAFRPPPGAGSRRSQR
ncbi:MAG: endonuclease III [Acidobacteria bacterium]|nr:endonuclease III [Acidobacteriota bacterium]